MTEPYSDQVKRRLIMRLEHQTQLNVETVTLQWFALVARAMIGTDEATDHGAAGSRFLLGEVATTAEQFASRLHATDMTLSELYEHLIGGPKSDTTEPAQRETPTVMPEHNRTYECPRCTGRTVGGPNGHCGVCGYRAPVIMDPEQGPTCGNCEFIFTQHYAECPNCGAPTA